eukprot:7684864-Ditylum_brightwellii.AAC.2
MRWASINLQLNNKDETDIIEMRKFMGVLYVITQSSRKGRVIGAFKEESDGLFPAPKHGWFGLKH